MTSPDHPAPPVQADIGAMLDAYRTCVVHAGSACDPDDWAELNRKEAAARQSILRLVAEKDERIGSLEAALKPFAKIGVLMDERHNDQLIYGPVLGREYDITGKHLRDAATALASTPTRSPTDER